MTHFPIRSGCMLRFKKHYFFGPWPNLKYAGHAFLKGRVIKHSYGAKKGQHTFSIEVLEVDNVDAHAPHKVGEKFRIKGRNLYPEVEEHWPGEEAKTVVRFKSVERVV